MATRYVNKERVHFLQHLSQTFMTDMPSVKTVWFQKLFTPE